MVHDMVLTVRKRTAHGHHQPRSITFFMCSSCIMVLHEDDRGYHLLQISSELKMRIGYNDTMDEYTVSSNCQAGYCHDCMKNQQIW